MDFCKLHGLGNDFLVVRSAPEHFQTSDFSELAVVACDRHYGIGSDGLVIVADCSSADQPCYGMRIFNTDGSESEMSGNGLRCAAAYLVHFCNVGLESIPFKTQAGMKIARLLERREWTYYFETHMGAPEFSISSIPMILDEPREPVIRYPLSVGEGMVEITALSMGNPHCVVFFDHWSEIDMDYLGFNLSNHPAFPNRINVEFVQVLSRNEIRVSFWERGVGATLSSGTGSCAAVVAAALNDFTEDTVTVRTSSGRAMVNWRNRKEVYLTGPAEILCRGEMYIPASTSCELY
jgi:diaminopimelate epimerase